MKHRLLIKKNAVKTIIDVAEIETENPITDFTVKDEKTIFFSHGHNIGLIDDGSIKPFWSGPQIPENPVEFGSLEQSTYLYPSSLFYCRFDNNLYTVENGGRFIRRIEISSQYTYSLMNGLCKSQIEYLFSKSPESGSTSIDIDEYGRIYWTSNLVHRCFRYANGDVSIVAGNGRAGFSVFNDPSCANLCFPNGICKVNNSLFISDTGNGQIRRINQDGIQSVARGLLEPRCIKKMNNRILFIENQRIRSISYEGNLFPSEVYKGNRIINLCCFGSNIYILEAL